MWFEQQEIPEVSQDIYRLARDGDLSDSEQQELLSQYETERTEIQNDIQAELQELKDFMSIFHSVEGISQDQKIQLQMILSIPRAQRDGVFWPSTFQKFLVFRSETWFSGNPEELIAVYESEKEHFLWLSLDEKKALQPEWGKDGEWWQNTFRYILSQKNTSLPPQEEPNMWEGDPLVLQTWEESSQEEILEPVLTDTIPERIPWDQHPEEILSQIPDEWEEESESLEEKSLRLREEANGFQRVLLRQLQEHLQELSVDGSFWPKSIERLLVVYPDIQSIQEAFERAGINTDIDWILSPNGDPEVFRNLYGEYIEQLGNDLGLPLGFIEAIIKQETTYGADLVSNTGSHGLMQLTRWPFKDMRGDSGDRIGVSLDTVRRYQEIFRRIDFETLLNTQIGEKGLARERMPENIIEAFQTIQESNDISQVQAQITLLYEYLKKSGDDFHDHEANMIIGSVYLAYLYANHWENIEVTAREYNSSPNEMYAYGRNVERYYNQIAAELSQITS